MNYRPYTLSFGLILGLSVCPFVMGSTSATEMQQLSKQSRVALARSFVSKMKDGFQRVNLRFQDADSDNQEIDLRGLKDGDTLIFELTLPERLAVEGTVIGQVYNKRVLLSLNDFVQILNFPIQYNADSNRYDGWFIRENQTFSLDPAERIALSAGKNFPLGENIIFQDNDVLVPLDDLSAWFKIDFDTNISRQILALDPEVPLPLMERIARRKWKDRGAAIEPPQLPRGEEEDRYELIDVPAIDVFTQSVLRANEGQDRDLRNTVNIRTAGEFAYGALTTNVAANNTDQITNARVSYLQEHTDPVLLGPLGARRFEVGDLIPTQLSLTGSSSLETGIRITNADSTRKTILPTTQISGFIFPGWDVELYRNNGLIGFQETDENGQYFFDNVRLTSDRNFFRIVSYGPQGEVREETLSVPFDGDREARNGGIYDVSVSLQNRQFYQKNKSDDQDRGSPHIVGFYETPVGAKSALRIGGRAREEEGEQKIYGNVGLSTTLAETLVNLDVAVDESGAAAASLALNRQFGEHSLTSDYDITTDDYNPGQGGDSVGSISSQHNLEGPLPLPIGENPRYAVNTTLSRNNDGDKAIGGFLNFNTQLQNIGFNQTLTYDDSSTASDGASLISGTSLSGVVGRSFIRGTANYEVKPDNELSNLTAFWRRRIDNELDTQLQVDHTLANDRTQYSAQLNWRPKYATISPSMSYDNDGNFQAFLNTRFGINRVPYSGDILFSKDQLTNTGTINAFVYLDKNGDLEFNGDDEPIEGAKITTPQNGGFGKVTDDNGVANIVRLRPNIVTDVYVDENSLEDPFWIPAREGKSLMPRVGTNIKLDFPVHIAGEIDGTVYIKNSDNSTRAAGGAKVNLYNQTGELIRSSYTGPDGFYILDRVPPGQYALMIDAKTVSGRDARPVPQDLKIGHDGTTFFGNDILMDGGSPDVPSNVVASLGALKSRHPHVDFDANPNIVLSLGDYTSNLSMALAWYKLKLRHRDVLRNGELLIAPSKSLTDLKSQKHVLRVAFPDETIDGAYARCRALIEREISCEVDILPGALSKFAAADKQAL